MKYITIIAFCLFFVLCAHTAAAQEKIVSLKPQVTSVTLTQPTTATTTITLENMTNEAQLYTAILTPFQPSKASDGSVIYPQDTKSTTHRFLAARVKLLSQDQEIQEIEVAAKQKKLLTLAITAGKNDKPADYYFSVIFTTQKPITVSNTTPDEVRATTTIATGIASHVLVSIFPKEEPTALSIETFQTNSFFPSGPVPFTIKAQNTGNHAHMITGYILVYNLFHQLIGKIDLQSSRVIANSTRYIPNKQSVENRQETHKNSSQHPVAWWNELFLLGPYSAELHTTVDGHAKESVQTRYFFGLPIWIGISLLTLLLCIVVLKNRVKRFL